MTDFPDLKIKALVSFPANAIGGAGIDVEKQNGNFVIDLDYDDFAPPVGGISDPSHQNALLWNDITKAYTLAPISLIGSGGSVPEAPNDGVQYGRQSLTWTPVVTGGGGGTPSNTSPIMDGVASPGVAAAYSRGDHVHPSDTSRAATVHTHTASQVTDFSEAVDDRIAGLLVAGANVTLTYNDAANTLTVAATGGGGGGSGDVTGPAGSITDSIAVFNGTTGKIIKDGGVAVAGLQPINQAVRYDAVQALTAAQQVQARQNVFAAPFDAMAYNGLQVNGSFEVDQPNAGASVAIAAGVAAPVHLMDGYWVSKSGTNAFTVQQVASVFPGYTKELKLTITTAQASIGSDNIDIRQSIEGNRVARLAWGTASAQPLTVGFWVKSSVAGLMNIYAANSTLAAVAFLTITIASANVAQFVTATFPAQTTGTWLTDNNTGIMIVIRPALTGTINIAATNGNTFEVTGLIVLPGLELPAATRAPFIMRPYHQELTASRRYFYNGAPPAHGVSATASSATRLSCRHPVSMRLAPTLTMTSALGVFDSAATTVATIPNSYGTAEVLEFDITTTGAVLGVGRPCSIYQSGNLNVDARLA